MTDKTNDGKTTDGNYPGLSANTVVYSNASRRLSSIPQGTVGQVLTAGVGGLVNWATDAGGSVTSVGCTVPSILSVSGVPITGAGTIAITTTVAPNGSGAILLTTSPSLITPNIGVASGTSIDLSGNVDVAIFGPSFAPLLPTNITVRNGPTSKLDICIAGVAGNYSTSSFQGDAILRSVNGRLLLQNGSNNASIILEGAGIINLPTLDWNTLPFVDGAGNLVSLPQGSVGQVLTAGVGGLVNWATDAGGSVTSVGCTVPSILNVSGVPITGVGTIAITTADTPSGSGSIVLQNNPLIGGAELNSCQLNDTALRLRNDPNHYLGFDVGFDGPKLMGFSGGGLSTISSGDILRWTSAGVGVTGGMEVSEYLIVTGDIDCCIFGQSSSPTTPTNILVRNANAQYCAICIAGAFGNFSFDSETGDAIIRTDNINNRVLIQAGPGSAEIIVGNTVYGLGALVRQLYTNNPIQIETLGIAPLVVSSNTQVLNLNSSLLQGNTWGDTGASGVGFTTRRPGSFSTLETDGTSTDELCITNVSNKIISLLNGGNGSMLGISGSGVIAYRQPNLRVMTKASQALTNGSYIKLTSFTLFTTNGEILTESAGDFTNNLGRLVYMTVSFTGTSSTATMCSIRIASGAINHAQNQAIDGISCTASFVLNEGSSISFQVKSSTAVSNFLSARIMMLIH